MTWRGDYQVCRLSDFEKVGVDGRVHVHIVREITIPDALEFPLPRLKDIGSPFEALLQGSEPIEEGEHAEPVLADGTEAASSSAGSMPPRALVRPYAGSARDLYMPWLTSIE